MTVYPRLLRAFDSCALASARAALASFRAFSEVCTVKSLMTCPSFSDLLLSYSIWAVASRASAVATLACATFRAA